MLARLSTDPLAPWWIVLPLALVAMVTIASHLIWIRGADEVMESRRRIRTANDVVMLVTIPLLAYAFGLATPAESRVFALVWMACVGLLLVIVLLAFIDSANSLLVNARQRRRLREDRRTELVRAAAIARLGGNVPSSENDDTPAGGRDA